MGVGSPEQLILRGQLGRPPRGFAGVAVRCPYGFPAVIESRPYLEDGTPFPTTLYLTCPAAVDVAGGVESAGGVETLRERLAAEPALAAAFAALEEAYRALRRRLARPGDGPVVDGGAVFLAGIGGPTPPERLTCLHAVLAALLAMERPDARLEVPEYARQPLREERERFGDVWCADVRCRRFLEDLGRVAALDVGTNSVRLLVAEAGEVGATFRTVTRGAMVTQLGFGLQPGGRLQAEARERTRAAVERYVVEARGLGAARVRLVATSAAREAADGAEFVADLGGSLGIEATVASGGEEAALSYRGATLDLPGTPLLVDLGGGSTEFVCRADGEILSISLPLGAVRAVHEQANGETSAVGTPGTYDAARAAVEEARRHALFEACGAADLVGVAGTVTTYACLALGLERYDPDAVHLCRLERTALARQIDRLAGMSAQDRRECPCVQPGRETVIVPGGRILLGIMDALGFVTLTVSERDLLDGIVLELLEARVGEEGGSGW